MWKTFEFYWEALKTVIRAKFHGYTDIHGILKKKEKAATTTHKNSKTGRLKTINSKK